MPFGKAHADGTVACKLTPANWVVLNALGSAFFWSTLTGRFFFQGYEASGLGGRLPGMSIVVGSFLAIAVVGLLGPKANDKTLFQLGCIVAVVNAGFDLANAQVSLAWLHEVDSALSSGICAIFVLAWCERISKTPRGSIPLFIALNSLLTVLLVLVGLQIDEKLFVVYMVALLLFSAFLGLGTSGAGPECEKGDRSSALPIYYLVILFLFGAMMSVLSLLSMGLPAVVGAAGDPFLTAWTVLVAVALVALAALLHKRPNAVSVTILVPVVAAGLLIPPFVSFGLQMMIPALLAFVVVCEAIVYSVAPSNAKQTFRIGRVEFTFWQRAWGILGIDAGYAATVFFFALFDVALSFNVIVWLFVGYALLCLTISMVLGRMGYRLPRNDRLLDLEDVCKSMQAKYGLTARETEVLELVAAGRSLPYVQEALHIAPSTAATHINHIYQKLDIHNRQELLDLVHGIPKD